MSGIAPVDLPRNWIAKAHALHSAGHFSRYSSTVLSEVLRKGYIGSTRPDDALRLARQKAAAGTAIRLPAVIDRLRSDFEIVGIAETQWTLSAVLEEPARLPTVGSVRNPRVV